MTSITIPHSLLLLLLKRTMAIIVILTIAMTSVAQDRAGKTSKRPLVVFVTGDHEYGSEATMPAIAAALEKHYGFRTKVLKAYPDYKSEENIPGLEALKEADIAVFYLRWRRLPADQVKHIEDFLKTGKPMVGFRTTTPAFNYPKGHALAQWNAFGEWAFNPPPGWGGVNKHTHYGHESSTDVTMIDSVSNDPILHGVGKSFHVRSWLYQVLPNYPSNGSKALMTGRSVNPNTTKAFDNPVAWTGTNRYGAKVFFTTMGHPEDFDQEPFQRLVINAMHWVAGKKIPKKWAGPMDIHVPYRK